MASGSRDGRKRPSSERPSAGNVVKATAVNAIRITTVRMSNISHPGQTGTEPRTDWLRSPGFRVLGEKAYSTVWELVTARCSSAVSHWNSERSVRMVFSAS